MSALIAHFMVYKGIDWVGTLLIFIAVYLMGKQRAVGFIYGCLGCLVWIFFGILSNSIAVVLMNIGLFILYAKGFFNWTSDSSEE